MTLVTTASLAYVATQVSLELVCWLSAADDQPASLRIIILFGDLLVGHRDKFQMILRKCLGLLG